MRIGIITQPLTSNYGGILQNYALQTILKRMGHQVFTMDIGKYSLGVWLDLFFRALIHKCLGHKVGFPDKPNYKKRIENPLRLFVKKNISLTEPRTRWLQKRIVEKYEFEAIIVGSDQVWRPNYNPRIADCFLKFIDNKNIKRIAYSASFGTDVWEFTEKQTRICAMLAKKFEAISVREFSGIELCEKHLGVNAVSLIDPTLLLSSDDYNKLTLNIKKHTPCIFAYLLDVSESKVNQIKLFAEQKKLNLYIKSAGTDITENDSIELWLSYFRDAEYVITDSFHGAVFSIIYQKEFYLYLNKERGNARFDSILRMFNLNSRIIVDGIIDLPKIDYLFIKSIIDKEVIKSLIWLQNLI